jgi:Zn-dependent protease
MVTEPVGDATVGPRTMRPIRLGHVFGVPVYLTPSWLIVAAVVTVSFAGIFDRAVPGTGAAAAHLFALAYAVLLALCVLLHELGHVVTAVALRLRVRRVVIFLFGGASEIDPEPSRARDELLVSAAGPLTSAGLAGLAWSARGLVAADSVIDVELQLLLWSNLSIAVFNALPGLPLDGGRALRAIVTAAGARRLTATRVAAVTGRVIAALVAGSGILLARGAGAIATVALSAMVGAFLWFGATQALVAARIAERVPLLRLAGLQRPAVWVPANLPLAEALRWAAEQHARAIVVLDGAEQPAAIVAEDLVARVDQGRRPWVPVSTVAVPIRSEAALPVELAGADLVEACRRHPAQSYLVLDAGGRPSAVVTAADIRQFLEGPEPAPAAA